MGFNSPVPVNLAQECAKARKILNSFVDGANNGLDQVIPRSVLQHAKGFAIFTVAKAGFLLSARAGSGLVIARLPNGDWSAPSAIGTAGLGFGGQAGAEVTDFLIVLNSRSAVASFMAAGSLNLGGNMSLAVGPLGRNAEGMGAVNTKGKVAAMYSYSKTKGLFGGVSVEGSVIVERQDANRLAYGSTISSKQLLSGSIPIPAFADDLVGAILSATGLPSGREWVEDRPPSASGTGWESEPIAPLGSPGLDGGRASYGFAGMGSGSGHGAAFSEGGGSKSGGGRSRSASLLSSVVGRNRSGSTASSTAAGGGGGGNAFGRNRGASVGSANLTSASSPRLDSTGGKSGGGGSPRPGLFSSVSFTGRKRASSKSFALGNPHDPPTLGGPEGDFHSSESYTSAGLSQRPGLAGSRRPSEYLDSKAGRRSPSDTADPNGLGLDGLEDDFARSARLTGDGGGSGNGRDRTFDDRFDQQRFDSSAEEPPLGRYSIEDDDDLPRSSSRPQQSPFHDPSDRFAPPPLSSPPTKIKKPKPWQARPELGSRKGSSQRGSDFHTQPNMYYVETGGEPGPPPPMSSTAGGGSSSSNRRETDLFADPSPASNGGGESAVRAEEDWSVLGSRARAGLARTQSGNVLSAAHASGVGGLGPSTSASSSSGDTQSPPQARSAAPFGARQQLGNQGDWSAAELRSAGYVGRGVALFDFAGVEVGDLSFHKGDVILLIEKTAEANDWWTGSVDGRGRTGSFPGTYIQLVD